MQQSEKERHSQKPLDVPLAGVSCVRYAVQGKSSAILLYGASKTGKTYTIEVSIVQCTLFAKCCTLSRHPQRMFADS